ncbi:MAG: hypothetical protein ACLQMH_01525 [Solirubrobacteraceae bacterium]
MSPARGPRRGVSAARAAIFALCFGIALAAASAAQAGPEPKLLDPSGSTVAAYGGWSAWSRVDETTGDYALTLRSPAGVISPADVPERPAPFDVELGPSGHGVAAVYSRCSNTAEALGCHIYELRLGARGASEQMLAAPGSSVHEPAVWDGVLVFLRRNPGGGTRRPDNLFVWRIGTTRARALSLPVSQGLVEGGEEHCMGACGPGEMGGRWPRGQTGAVGGLTLRGQQLAYSTSSTDESFGVASLWLQGTSGRPRLIDQVTSGAGATCEHAFLSPMLSGGWLYAYLHDCDPSADPTLDRWTRYAITGHTAQRAAFTFIRTGDESIDSVVADGSGVEWANESGLHRLSSVSWRTIGRPVAETFCTLAQPFC